MWSRCRWQCLCHGPVCECVHALFHNELKIAIPRAEDVGARPCFDIHLNKVHLKFFWKINMYTNYLNCKQQRKCINTRCCSSTRLTMFLLLPFLRRTFSQHEKCIWFAFVSTCFLPTLFLTYSILLASILVYRLCTARLCRPPLVQHMQMHVSSIVCHMNCTSTCSLCAAWIFWGNFCWYSWISECTARQRTLRWLS